MVPKIYIIILNWNGLQDTAECLESLRKIDYSNFEVVIVDNASDGNDVKKLKEGFGDFIYKIISAENNLGFSGGNNLGIEYVVANCEPDYILLLNNDVVVEKDFLSKLVKSSGQNKQIGISAPLIKYYDKRDVVWSAGGYIDKYRGSGFSYVDAYLRSTEEGTHLKYSFVSGCCMLISRDAINSVKGFDDDFFLYLEDVDLCYRATKAGFRIKVVKDSVIYHKVNAASKGGYNLIPLYYNTRNRLLFARKNLGGYFFVVVAYMIVVFLVKFVYRYKEIHYRKTVIKAFYDFFHKKFGKVEYSELRYANSD